jgi:hypothetical protein
MIRRAILVSSSPHDNSIPGAGLEVAAFDDFLQSSTGGAWTRQEVVSLIDPTKAAVLTEVKAATAADYSLVFFAGESEMVKLGRPWQEARILLSLGDTMIERELNPGSPRCTLILDCCRHSVQASAGSRVASSSALPKRETLPKASRSAYDEALLRAEAGLVKVFAMAVGAAASDTPSFTQHLILKAKQWATNSGGVLSLDEAIALAVESSQHDNRLRPAQYFGGRRVRHFPFAVSI